LGVIAPWVHTPKNVALGYDVGKIRAGCLVVAKVDLVTLTYELCPDILKLHLCLV